MKKIVAIATLGLLGGIAAHGVTAAEHASAAEESAKLLAEQVCSVCHGPGGHSTLPDTPSLAAQSRSYLIAKMRRFRDRSAAQPDDHIDVLGLALLDDPATDALARYFADQPPPSPVTADAALIAAGGKVFTQGMPEKKIVACSVCHGSNAAGFWVFPRLAGQQAEYVQRQLGLIQLHLRDSPMMHGIVKNMTADDIKAVAAFVQSK